MKSYGSPRVHQELLSRGKACSKNTVAKLMRTNGLAAKTRKKYKATTDSAHSLPLAENVLNREFEQIDPIFDDLKVTTRNVSEFSTNINAQSEDLPEITRNLKETLAAVKTVMTDLSQTTPHLPQIAENITDATDDVPVLVLQLQQAIIELELLLRQLQSHWLLGGSGQKSSTQSVRISPLEVSP